MPEQPDNKDPRDVWSPKPSDEKARKKDKEGWIEGLARKSTGLPSETSGGEGNGGKETEKGAMSPWKYAGLGLQLAATVGLFAFMGYGLDRQTGWTPWGLVSLTMVALIGGMYLLIKEMMKANADMDERDRKK